jgi:mono/diheme cytochrome c family protein
MRVSIAVWSLAVIIGLTALAQDGKKSEVTFNKDIAPIVFNHCAVCHHPGEVAPFSLLTYEDVKKRERNILYVTGKRLMPPWKPEPGFGEFQDCRRLSDQQIALIKQWVDDGMPQGDLKDLPAPPKFADGWMLGEPDLVVKMPEAFTVPAEGRDVYRCFVLPLNLPEDKFVMAAEYRPGNRRVVHHALLFLDGTGAARRLDEKDPGVGYYAMGGPGFIPQGGLGGWAPGATPHPLPDGIGWPIKKGMDLVIQTHFYPTGKEEKEQSSVGIYFCKKEPQRVSVTIPVASRKLNIPPGEADYKISKSFEFPVDVDVIGVIPHAHLLCREIKATYTTPDGDKPNPFIWIKDWDFNWQDHYRYREILHFAKGTRIDMEFTYDNSEANARNPNRPPKRVRWGEQTTDEMCILFVQIVPQKQSDITTIFMELLRQSR